MVFLVALPLILFGAVGNAIGADEGLFFGLLLAAILIAGVYLLCNRIVLKMCRAEKLTVYHAPTLFGVVKDLSAKVRLPAPEIFVIDEDAPNALAVSRNRRTSGVVLTTGLLKALSAEELRSVIAHQLIQIKNFDAFFGCVAATIAALFGLASKSARQTATTETYASSLLQKAGRVAFSGALAVLAPIAALCIQSLVGVRRVFHADDQGSRVSGNSLSMANAIRTMEKKKFVAPMTIVPAAAHLFMVSPLTTGRIARLLMLHPSMEERITRLEKMHGSALASRSTSVARMK